MKDNNNDKKKDELSIRSSAAEYLTYIASTGNDGEDTGIEMRYEDENIWLTQKMMAEIDDHIRVSLDLWIPETVETS